MLNKIKKMLKDDSGLGLVSFGCIIPNWISAIAGLATLGDICGTHIIAPCIDGCVIAIETITGLEGMIMDCGVDCLLRCFGK